MVQRNFLICWIFQIDYQISKLRLLVFYWKIIKHIKYLIWLNLILHKLFGLIGINQTNSIICWLQWSTQVTKLKKKMHIFSYSLRNCMKTEKPRKTQIFKSSVIPRFQTHHLTCFLALMDASCCTIELVTTNDTSWATIDQIS